MFNYFIFDLDGTLSDPKEGITNSVSYALNKFGITVKDKSVLTKFIGPPLYNSFTEFYSFCDSDAKLAVKYYREYFSDKGLFENKLYDDVLFVLRTLKSKNKKIILATSKPEEFTLRILKKFKIFDLFDYISAENMNNFSGQKSDIIKKAIGVLNIPLSSAVMIGDRKFDILGAKSVGIKSVGVLYGYGEKSELLESGADYLINSPIDVLNFLK